MVPFTLRQLEYFVAVAEAGSLRDAARAMHVSESALAAGVIQMEHQLGVKLSVRKKSQGVTLTSAGRIFAEEARSLIRSASSLHERAVGTGGKVSGRVVVGCPESGAATLLPPILMSLRESHPGIDLEFELAPHRAQLLPELATGGIDLALTTLFGLPAGFVWESLATRPVMVMLDARHPLAKLDSIPPAALADEPMILLDLSPSVERTLETFRAVGVEPRVEFRTDNMELVRSLVGRGLGFALQIQRPYSDITYEGMALAYRPLAGGYTETAIIAWPETGELSPAAKVVVKTAVEVSERGAPESKGAHRMPGLPSTS